jgi:hypothetical protein
MTRRGSGIAERRLGSAYLVPALSARRLYWRREEDPSRGHFTGRNRFTRKRPFDYSVACEGRAYAIEAKVAHPRVTLRPHQEEQLARFERDGGGVALIAVFTKAGRVWTLWILRYRVFKRYVHRYGRKSFPARDLPRHATPCPRTNGVFQIPLGKARRRVEHRKRPATTEAAA